MLVGNNESATTKNAGELILLCYLAMLVGNNESATTKNAGELLAISIATGMCLHRIAPAAAMVDKFEVKPWMCFIGRCAWSL